MSLSCLDALAVFATTGGFGCSADTLLQLCRSTWTDTRLGDGASRVRLGRFSRTRLMHAAMIGNVERVQWLLDRRADAEAEYTRLIYREMALTPLSLACTEGHSEVARLLIDRGATVTNTCLEFAAKGGHLDVCELLLRHGAFCAPTCVISACASGNVDLVTLLIDGYMSNNSTDEAAEFFLAACGGGRLPILQLMLTKFHIPDATQGRGLHKAAEKNLPDIVQALLNLGVPVDVLMERPSFSITDSAVTPLHTACMHNSVAAADILLTHGASVSAVYTGSVMSVYGYLPLHIAAVSGDANLIRLLLFHGADVGALVRNNSSSALTIVVETVQREHSSEVLIALVTAALERDPPFIRDFPLVVGSVLTNFMDESTALWLVEKGVARSARDFALACKYGRAHTVDALLAAGLDPIKVQKESYMSLLKLAAASNVDIVRALLQHGLSANGRPGDYPLIYCCSNSLFDVATLLIESGADVNTYPEGGDAPLSALLKCLIYVHYLVDCEDGYGLMECMLNHGADPNCSSASDDDPAPSWAPSEKMPLTRVCELDDTVLAALLLEYGADVLFATLADDKGYLTAGPQLTRMLIGHGFDINKPIRGYESSVACAVAAGARGLEVARLLYEAGARLDGVSDDAIFKLQLT